MERKRKMLDRYSTFDIIVIAFMAAIGLATKPIIIPLTHMVTGPLFIPGGAVAGGFYMLWIILSAAIVNKRGAATITAFTQALIVIITGSFGSHGMISIFTYTLPGLMIDIVFLLFNRRFNHILDFFAAGIIANLSGIYLSNLFFFKLPLIPLVLSLLCGILSGGMGGLIAYKINERIKIIGFNENEYEV